MKPLVTAVVSDATGTMEATFFNQPWLANRYTPGTRLILTGKYQAHNRFRVSSTRSPRARRRRGGDLSRHGRADLRPDPGARARPPAADCTRDRAAARPAARRERPAGRAAALDAAHFGDQEAGRRRLAFDELLLFQLAFLQRRALRRAVRPGDPARRAGDAQRRPGPRPCPSRPRTTRPRRWPPSTRTSPAERPMQRLLMGEVGSGKTVVALYAMLRAVENGAQAALMAPTETLAEQHFATLQTLLPHAMVSVALLTGATPQARRRTLLAKLGTRRAQPAGRHPRADRGARGVRPAGGRRRRRAAPLRRQPAPRAGPQGAARPGPARPAHDGDADPAHPGADRLRRPRHHHPARAARRPPADRDPRRQHRGRARPGLRRASARSSTPAARRSSSARWSRQRGAGGARGDRRVRAAAARRVPRPPRSCSCTAA